MNDLFTSNTFADLLTTLRRLECEDSVNAWPHQQLNAMTAAGVMTWDVPTSFGGIDLSPVDQVQGLRQLAACCLVSTFILTQRSAAVRRIATSENSDAKQTWLPELLAGNIFATVGISHLTTSGQHLKSPRVTAEPVGDGFILNGVVPWATGATMADLLVTGGTLPDGREVLVCLPTRRPGVSAQPPVELLGLNASQTGTVTLDNVDVEAAELLHGPLEGVMRHGTGGGAGSIGTSALAIGAAAGTLRQFSEEADKRPDLREFTQPLQDECNRLTDDLLMAASGTHPAGDAAAEQLRRAANSLVLRSAQAWLAATKGAGYVAGHPAAQAVRESLFFLVWSCPQPVLAANLRELACTSG
ncbi:MAG: acyl-CoA dehydrogenase family protein [Planctomycetaceae bacterium]